MLRTLLPDGAESLWRDPTGKVVLAEVAYSDRWLGEKVKMLEQATGARIAFISRLGQAILPEPATVLQEGDLVHVIAVESDLERISREFAKRLEGAH
jgi:trk system potassium uptake protein